MNTHYTTSVIICSAFTKNARFILLRTKDAIEFEHFKIKIKWQKLVSAGLEHVS